jgi:mannose-6-phosphate isomerase-like protein (cupin superfamily)
MNAIDVRAMTPEQKETYHKEAEAKIQLLKYASPFPANSRPKDVVRLGQTNLMTSLVQIVRDGGENNLHYHTNGDTTWLVLRGRARFYGLDDVVLGEFGEREGILMPGGARYWFEKAGEGDLEILQIIAKMPGVKSERINVDGHKDWMESNDFLKVYDSDKANAG